MWYLNHSLFMFFVCFKAGETALYEAYLYKRGLIVLMFARKGTYLSALEQANLKSKFRTDVSGLKLLMLPHEDAIKRVKGGLLLEKK